jgi:hypothetical protein
VSLLGPDGQPLERSRYTKPEPEPPTSGDAPVLTSAALRAAMRAVTARPYQLALTRWAIPFLVDLEEPPPTRTLADRVTADLAALTADMVAGPVPREMPRRDPDPSAYADAYAEAVRSCIHEDLEMASGGYHCLECDQVVTRAQIMRARGLR